MVIGSVFERWKIGKYSASIIDDKEFDQLKKKQGKKKKKEKKSNEELNIWAKLFKARLS